jgi:hypothetical protein
MRVKLAVAFAVLLFATITRADSIPAATDTLPIVPAGDYFYVNAYYEWSNAGVDYEQFFFNVFQDGGNQTGLSAWEYGPVADFTPMGILDPAQFGPNNQPLNMPEPPLFWYLCASLVGLILFRSYVKEKVQG